WCRTLLPSSIRFISPRRTWSVGPTVATRRCTWLLPIPTVSGPSPCSTRTTLHPMPSTFQFPTPLLRPLRLERIRLIPSLPLPSFGRRRGPRCARCPSQISVRSGALGRLVRSVPDPVYDQILSLAQAVPFAKVRQPVLAFFAVSRGGPEQYPYYWTLSAEDQ